MSGMGLQGLGTDRNFFANAFEKALKNTNDYHGSRTFLHPLVKMGECYVQYQKGDEFRYAFLGGTIAVALIVGILLPSVSTEYGDWVKSIVTPAQKASGLDAAMTAWVFGFFTAHITEFVINRYHKWMYRHEKYYLKERRIEKIIEKCKFRRDELENVFEYIVNCTRRNIEMLHKNSGKLTQVLDDFMYEIDWFTVKGHFQNLIGFYHAKCIIFDELDPNLIHKLSESYELPESIISSVLLFTASRLRENLNQSGVRSEDCAEILIELISGSHRGRRLFIDQQILCRKDFDELQAEHNDKQSELERLKRERNQRNPSPKEELLEQVGTLQQQVKKRSPNTETATLTATTAPTQIDPKNKSPKLATNTLATTAATATATTDQIPQTKKKSPKQEHISLVPETSEALSTIPLLATSAETNVQQNTGLPSRGIVRPETMSPPTNTAATANVQQPTTQPILSAPLQTIAAIFRISPRTRANQNSGTESKNSPPVSSSSADQEQRRASLALTNNTELSNIFGGGMQQATYRAPSKSTLTDDYDVEAARGQQFDEPTNPHSSGSGDGQDGKQLLDLSSIELERKISELRKSLADTQQKLASLPQRFPTAPLETFSKSSNSDLQKLKEETSKTEAPVMLDIPPTMRRFSAPPTPGTYTTSLAQDVEQNLPRSRSAVHMTQAPVVGFSRSTSKNSSSGNEGMFFTRRTPTDDWDHLEFEANPTSTAAPKIPKKLPPKDHESSSSGRSSPDLG